MSNLLSTPQGIDAVREAILDALRRRIRRYFDQNTIDMYLDWVQAGKPAPGMPEMAEVVGLLNDLNDQDVLNLRELLNYYVPVGPPPAAHALTHELGGTDVIDVGGLSGVLADAQTPVLHGSDHEFGGADAIDVGGLSGVLADAQTPVLHGSDHEFGGADVIKLDDLGTPDDNTDLDASLTKHGLLPKLSNVSTDFLNGLGAWATPSGASALFADMWLDNNSTVQTNETANIDILTRHWTMGSLNGWGFVGGSTGSISAYGDYGGTVPGTVRAVSVAHGLATGDIISIRGTVNYNGVFVITKISNDSFYIIAVWVADDGASDWDQGSYLIAGAGAAGEYKLSYVVSAYAQAMVATDIEMKIFQGDGKILKTISRVNYLAVASALKTFAGQALISVAVGDRIFLAVSGSVNNANPTLRYGSVIISQ